MDSKTQLESENIALNLLDLNSTELNALTASET